MNNRLLLARRYSWACVNVIFLVKQKIFFARKRLSNDSLRVKRFKVVRSSRKSTKPQQLSLFAQLEWQRSHEHLELLKQKDRVVIPFEYDDREIKQNTYLESDQENEEREAILAENREEPENLILLGDEDLDIAEYDSTASQHLNEIAHEKYFGSAYDDYF
jgi:hypothetical protein